MRLLTSLLVLFICASCELNLDLDLDLIKPKDVYTIPQGQHFSMSSFKGFDGSTLTFAAKFNQTAIYKTTDATNQEDINKLMGFSSCESHHHQNSARIGWRWFNEKLEIFAYIYSEGNRTEEFIANVPLDQYQNYEISRVPEGYKFTVGTTEKLIEVASGCGEGGNYMLWPYFGGDEPAPHDITIQIDNIFQKTVSGEQFKIGG